MGGIEAAKGTYIIMGDADESYDWSEIAHFIEQLRNGQELVMGCRFPHGGGEFCQAPCLGFIVGSGILF